MICWKSNLPTIAWLDNARDRLVQIEKRIFEKTLCTAILSHDQRISILSHCEQVVYDRPLT